MKARSVKGTLAVLHASQLVTLAGPKRPRVGAELCDLAIIPDGGMLVRDGVIVATGPSDVIEKQMPGDAEVVDATGRVVLPGFVDAHAHPVFAGNRVDEFEMRARGATYEEIAAGGGGIRSTVRKTRAATEDQLLAQAIKHAEWFIRCGTTTVEAKSGYGLSVEDEIKILRVVRRLNKETPVEFVPTFLGAHAIPEDFQSAPDRYVSLVIDEMLPRIADERLAEFCDVFCERGYFDVETSRKVLSAARERGMGIRMHADQLTNGGGAELAAELGAVTADHLEQTEAPGIAAMKRAGVQPVLLPGSVYSLGKTRYPRAREMIEAGLAVVIATDFNPGFFADTIHADGVVARCDADENDARGRGDRGNDQRRLQLEAWRQDRLPGSRQARQLRALRLRRLPGTRVLLRCAADAFGLRAR